MSSRAVAKNDYQPPVEASVPEAVVMSEDVSPVAHGLTNSMKHSSAKCPQKKKADPPGRKTRRGKSRDKQVWREVGSSGVKAKHLSLDGQNTSPPGLADLARQSAQEEPIAQEEGTEQGI
ncbi:hypothetical protein HID58_033640 [Brassica napus]|uniref:AT-hook motif nuclear-localized protein n=1 Tax=Brassica napus TaxID=3708 RepID=A0ABQ8BZW9_BRANA|nr:hypothetical protein HID58_033640 [Brassica napus]